jgi:SAM-dependent methyltransferase
MPADGSPTPHSAAYFNEQRDFWWNADYLELIGRRLDLRSCHRALDVGSGVGHWGRLVLPLLAADAIVDGVDPEREWVARARHAADEAGIGDRLEYRVGSVAHLPFADGTFDLVTCQTLLIHIDDVADALREMVRVLAPGGLLLAAEPNNLASSLVCDSLTAGDSIADVLERVEFMLICERGKLALGEGNSSVGDLLPELCRRAGLTELQTFLNDKTFALSPPYLTADQRALRSGIIDDADAGRWMSPEPDVRRCFLAGGGDEHDFTRRWQRRLRATRRAADELRADRFSSAGGGIQYVIAGRRPPITPATRA